MDDNMYKFMYQIGAGSSKFYGLPKIHKKGMPFDQSYQAGIQ